MNSAERGDNGEASKTRPTSRRDPGPFSRRGSSKEPEVNRPTPSTPKSVKRQNPDLIVTGKQLLGRGDRADSPSRSHPRRQSVDSLLKSKRITDSPRRVTPCTKSRDASLEDDLSSDISQVAHLEDISLNDASRDKLTPLVTSTPKKLCQKPRSRSVQSGSQRECRRGIQSADSKLSRDSVHKTSSSGSHSTQANRRAVSTELNYSSMSPEHSAPSSVESVSAKADNLLSPESQDSQDRGIQLEACATGSNERAGEWAHFWADYDNALGKAPVSRFYDQCPTPYRSEEVALADFGPERSGARSPPPRGALTLRLTGTALPAAARERKRWQSVPTQTDISLPNTESAPRIFESILRQLSASGPGVDAGPHDII